MPGSEWPRRMVMRRDTLARILPFAVFMVFIGIEEIGRFLLSAGWIAIEDGYLQVIYPVSVVAAASVLFIFRKNYTEIERSDIRNIPHLLWGAAVGLLVFFLWLKMEWGPVIGFPSRLKPSAFGSTFALPGLAAARIAGSVLVIPLMEELFWRSFLTRYIIGDDFMSVPLGRFTLFSFAATAILFGLEHHLFLAGLMAGVAYNSILWFRRSLVPCIMAHAVTNLALGLYVLFTGRWTLWS